MEKTIRELCEENDRERADAGKDVNENNGRESLGPEVRSRSGTIPEESRFTIPVFGELCHLDRGLDS